MAQSEAYSTVETWWKQCQEYSSQSNDALITLFAKGLETILVVLSKTSDNFCIERSVASLDYERKLALECESKDFDVLRHLSFGLIESLQVLLEAKEGINTKRNQALVDQAPDTSPIAVPKEELIDPFQSILDGQQNPAADFAGDSLFKEEDIDFEFGVNDTTFPVDKSTNELSANVSHGNDLNPSLTIVEPKEEPIDPIDRILEENQLPIVDDFMEESLFKEEEIDFDFCAINAAPPVENLLNELPSNDEDSQGNIMDDRNSTPIEKESSNDLSSNAENADEFAQNEMIGVANVSMEEEVVNDFTVHYTTDTSKDSSETGKVEKKMSPSRTSSKPAKFTESLDESEPVEKKPRTKPEKKIDNKRRSDGDESSFKLFAKGVRVTKINHTELECPKCEYRSRSVHGWYLHLFNAHSTNPHELSLALLCECGNESFSATHSLQCEISKITIVRKSATPKCVKCEIYPKTVGAYAFHLKVHHKTTLKQMGIFLICSCGHNRRSHHVDPEHTKKCNGHEFTLHKVDEE